MVYESMGIKRAAMALRAIADRSRCVLTRTTEPSPKNSAVKPEGIATRTGAEKSFQPQITKEIAAMKSKKIPRNSRACSVRSERMERHKRSRNGGRGAEGGVSLGSVGGKGADLLRSRFISVLRSACISTRGLSLASNLAFSVRRGVLTIDLALTCANSPAAARA